MKFVRPLLARPDPILPRATWIAGILISLDGERDELEHRIKVSYDIIAKSLTKKVRDALE